MAQRLHVQMSGSQSAERDGKPLDGKAGDHRVRIADQWVEPGQQRMLDLPVAELPTGTWLSLPIHVLCGAQPGPRVWLTATIHGEELNGLEIARRVLEKLSRRNLSGALIVVPVMNVLGFMNQTRTLPDGSDLNRAFPGSPEGTLAQRLAFFFMQEVVAQCEYGIDLHSGASNRLNPPQIRADLDDPETRRLAEAFAAPIIMNAGLGKGSLRTAAVKAGKRVLLFEGGEPLRFNGDSLRAGADGVLRVLEALGIAPQGTKQPRTPPIEVSSDDKWVKAPRCGVIRFNVDVKDEVRKNDVLGVVADVLGGKSEQVLAPFDGVVIGITLNPLVAKDGGVLHLAKRVH